MFIFCRCLSSFDVVFAVVGFGGVVISFVVVLVVLVALGARREAEHRAAQLAFREADLVKEAEAQRRRADETFLEVDVR